MDFTGFLGNDAVKARLSGAFASGRVAHSYLLCGPAGSGKHTLTRILSAAMQCEGRSGKIPCGVCSGCRKALEGVHPDIITVDDPDHKAMTVDPIRAARSDMFIRPNEGKRKIYIIPRGQDMNESAQNALLKILEEPPDYGVFLILSTNAERLLPTIRSRCAELQLGPVAQDEALPFLRQNAPDKPDGVLRAAYLRAQRRRRRLVLALQILLLAAFLGLWELTARLGWVDAFIVSSPSRVVHTLVGLQNSGELWLHIGTSCLEVVVGFVLGTLLGTLIAIGLWWSELLSRVLDPYLVVLNALPKTALGPVFIVWIGAGTESIIAMTIAISIFVTILNMHVGFLSTDREKIRLMQTLGATRHQILWRLVIPANYATLFNTLRVNVGLSWVGVIMGEFLVSKAGLGYLIVYGSQVFNMDLVMATVLVLAVAAVVMYQLVLWLEKFFKNRLGVTQ